MLNVGDEVECFGYGNEWDGRTGVITSLDPAFGGIAYCKQWFRKGKFEFGHGAMYQKNLRRIERPEDFEFDI